MFPGCRALTFPDADPVAPGLGLLLGCLVYSELGGTEARWGHQVPPLNRSWLSQASGTVAFPGRAHQASHI